MDTLEGAVKSAEAWSGEGPLSARLRRVTEESLNDAVEELWRAIMTVQVSQFVGGPVSVTFAAAAERASIVSIADPLGAPAPVAVADAGSALGVRNNMSVTYTLVTESGSETLESPAAVVSPANAQVVSVPPPAFVDGAVGWNIYVGTVAGRRARQSEAPLRFNETWQEPSGGATDEPEMPSPPVENTTADNIAYIKHLEAATPEGGYLAWPQADIDSSLGRLAAASIASTSAYQRYAWDLIDGRTIEIRPKAGAAVSPRYFFVQKPRKLRVANSPLPFANFTGRDEFIRNKAVSAIKLAVDEFVASDSYLKRAMLAKQSILEEVMMRNFNKDVTVQRYL